MLEFLIGVYLVCWFVDGVIDMIIEGQSWTEWHWFKTPRKKG